MQSKRLQKERTEDIVKQDLQSAIFRKDYHAANCFETELKKLDLLRELDIKVAAEDWKGAADLDDQISI